MIQTFQIVHACKEVADNVPILFGVGDKVTATSCSQHTTGPRCADDTTKTST